MKIKRVTIDMKHNDLVNMELVDETGKRVFEHDGYMPQLGMFNEGDDQTTLVVDNETGVNQRKKTTTITTKLTMMMMMRIKP
jgi:hypothetical protein